MVERETDFPVFLPIFPWYFDAHIFAKALEGRIDRDFEFERERFG